MSTVTVSRIFCVFCVLVSMIISSVAQDAKRVRASGGELQSRLDEAVRRILKQFAEIKLQPDQLAVTVMDVSRPNSPMRASYRGDVQVYPASVIKLFYLVAVHEWLEERKLQDTEELRRAMRDMIVDSSNEATHYIVDLLSGTTSGPELPPDELEAWYNKRNVVNRYFASLGYEKINVNRKPWCEGPYGRESQSVKVHQPNHRNWLTTDATARLMSEIATGKAVSAARCAEMKKLLERDPFTQEGSAGDQARGYTGRALSPGDKLWSKAGWTSQVRHDAAYVELSGGEQFVVVIFTSGHSNEREIIVSLAKAILN